MNEVKFGIRRRGVRQKTTLEIWPRPGDGVPVARVAELADAPDLGSGGETCGGSSPPSRTIYAFNGEVRSRRYTFENIRFGAGVMEKGR